MDLLFRSNQQRIPQFPFTVRVTYIAVALKYTIVSRKELIRQTREKPILVAGANMERRFGGDEARVAHLEHRTFSRHFARGRLGSYAP